MPSSVSLPKESRLSTRANESQKTALARGAGTAYERQPVRAASSLSAAQEIIEVETHIEVSAEEYQWLCEIMDAPATPAPRLRAALNQKPVWDE